jgi:hypothetical protein
MLHPRRGSGPSFFTPHSTIATSPSALAARSRSYGPSEATWSPVNSAPKRPMLKGDCAVRRLDAEYFSGVLPILHIAQALPSALSKSDPPLLARSDPRTLHMCMRPQWGGLHGGG